MTLYETTKKLHATVQITAEATAERLGKEANFSLQTKKPKFDLRKPTLMSVCVLAK